MQMTMASVTTKKQKNDNYKRTPSRAEKEAAEKILYLRLLVILVYDIIIGVYFNHVMHSSSEKEYFFYFSVRPVLKVVSIVLLAAAVGYLVYTIVKKIETTKHFVTPEMCVGGALFFVISVFAYNIFRINPALYFIVMIVGSVLFAVYYIYTKMLYR